MKKVALALCLFTGTVGAAEDLWYEIAVENATPKKVWREGVVRYQAPNYTPAGHADRVFKVGDMLTCDNGTFGDPVPGTVKQCISHDRWLLVEPGKEEKAVGWKCLPYTPKAANFNLTLNPSGGLAWLSADGTASYTMSWWCMSKYDAELQIAVGFKRELGFEQIKTFVNSYLAKSEAEKRVLLESNMECKPGMLLSDPKCLQYDLLIKSTRNQAQWDRPPGPFWKVAKNSTYLTRPTKVVVGTARTATDGKETVKVGTICSCNKQVFEEATVTYCSVEGADDAKTTAVDQIPANRVAVCTDK